jgi:hypothetical protein
MNSNTHNAGIKAWRYSVTRADRKDLGKLLAPIARPDKPYTRDTQGRIDGALCRASRLNDFGCHDTV